MGYPWQTVGSCSSFPSGKYLYIFSLNVPVWRLLGGRVRDRIRMYGWLSLEPTGDYIDQYAKSINENVEGFTAYKTCPIPPMQMIEQPNVLHAIRDNVILLREKIDKRIDVALDFHGRCTPAMVSCLHHLTLLYEFSFLVSTSHSYVRRCGYHVYR